MLSLGMDLNTLLKHTSRSLYLSAKILPANIRPAFGLAYLLCRCADTIADTSVLPADQRIYWIQLFPQLVRQPDAVKQTELIHTLTGTSDNPYETALIEHLGDCLHALNEISASQRTFIEEVVRAVCEGMKTFFPAGHAAPKPFEKSTDLTHYCRLMGGRPGLFWSQLIFHSLHIFLDKEPFYELGQQIGDSLQIVNILRDLPKDLQNGRCYFPQTDLEKENLTVQDLLNPANSAKFYPIKQKWLLWGKQNLAAAPAYFAALPKFAWRIRAAVAWPMLWTADTFIKLKNTPDLLNPHKRVKISRLRIYATMLVTPLLLASNRFFETWVTYKLKQLS